MLKLCVIFVSAVTVFAAGPAMAVPDAGSLSITGAIGSAIPAGGDVLKGTTAAIPDLGPFNPALTGNSATVVTTNRKTEKNYAGGLYLDTEIGYGLGNGLEAFGQVAYTQLRGGTSAYGTMTIPSQATTVPLYAKLNDIQSTTIEGGLRKQFAMGSWRPYIDGRLGVAITDDVKVSLNAPGAPSGGVVFPEARLYKAGASFAAGGDVGVDYAMSDKASVGVSAGLNYLGARKKDGAALRADGFGQIASDDGVWTAPIAATVKVQF